jgi:hypothetical protein
MIEEDLGPGLEDARDEKLVIGLRDGGQER